MFIICVNMEMRMNKHRLLHANGSQRKTFEMSLFRSHGSQALNSGTQNWLQAHSGIGVCVCKINSQKRV